SASSPDSPWTIFSRSSALRPISMIGFGVFLLAMSAFLIKLGCVGLGGLLLLRWVSRACPARRRIIGVERVVRRHARRQPSAEAYSNGCGRGVSLLDGGRIGSAKLGWSPVRVLRKAVILPTSSS